MNRTALLERNIFKTNNFFNYKAIADTLGTKTEAHVRFFYINQRRRYNLDQIIKKHEADKEANAAAAAASATSTVASASDTCTVTNSTAETSAVNSTSVGKKEEQQQQPKKKDVPNSVNEESDNTTSSETAISKSTISTTTTSDERKSESSASVGPTQKDNVIMEVGIIIYKKTFYVFVNTFASRKRNGPKYIKIN